MSGNKRSASNDTKIAVLENTIINISDTLKELKQDNRDFRQSIEKRFDSIDDKFGSVDAKFSSINIRFDKIDLEIKSNFKWLLNIMLGGFILTFSALCGVLVVMAHGFKWF